MRRAKIDKARRDIHDKKELDDAKLEYAEKLKRKLAVQAMMNTMKVRLIFCVVLCYPFEVLNFKFYSKRKKNFSWQLKRRRQPGELR